MYRFIFVLVTLMTCNGQSLPQLQQTPGRPLQQPGQLQQTPGQQLLQPGQLQQTPGQQLLQPGQLQQTPSQQLLQPGQLQQTPGQQLLQPGQLQQTPGQQLLQPGQLQQTTGQPLQPSPLCPQNNVYIPIEGKNYYYIECKDYQPITRTCPTGYFFNPQAQWPENPCKNNIAIPTISNVQPQVILQNLNITRASCENIRNAYIDEGFCDTYTECRNFKPIKRVCPDGLNFNPAAKWPAYPCRYPTEAPCRGRQQIQVPKPTADCQRQYGIFSSPRAAANECDKYIICSAGYAYNMKCPAGLAFNPATSSCDWPYNVPSCNVNEFYGMTCPPAEIDESGNPVVVNLKYGNECQYFFSCQTGNGRLLKCDPGFAFNAASGRCENADYVDCYAQNNSKAHPSKY